MTPSGLAPGLPSGKTRCLLFLAAIILLTRSGAYGAQEWPQGAADPDSSSPSSLGGASAAGAQDLLLTHVNVVPMDSPRVLRDQVVLIRDGLIHAIGPPGQFTDISAPRTIDGQGGYLLPGLTDAHVHLDEALGARPDFGDGVLYFAAGITSVINMRGDEVSLELRRRIEQGELIAPSLYTAGEFINEPYVTSPEQVAQEVTRQVESGVDIIKFHEFFFGEQHTSVGLSREAYNRMVQTAKELQVPLVGHTPHNLGLAAVLEEGQSLAHLNALLEHDLLPDPSERFQVYAKTTKWSGLTLLALSLAIALWELYSRRGGSLVMAAAVSAFVLGAAFLYVWEHTYWAGADRLILILQSLGALLLLLAAISAFSILRKGSAVGRRISLTALLVPLTVLLFSLSYWLPLAWRTSDRRLDELASALRAKEISVMTTLVVSSGVTPDQFEPWYRFLSEKAQWLRKSSPVEKQPFYQPNLEVANWTRLEKVLVRKLQDAGVPLIAGTDAMGYPLMISGIAMQRELELLLESGLTPFEVLRTATAAPATLLGREDEFGTIEVGKRADLVLVQTNPLEGLATLRDPRGICVRGHWLFRDQLDLMLARLAEESSAAG